MSEWKLFNLFVVVNTVLLLITVTLSVKAEDSYLSALQNSHQTANKNSNNNVISRKEYSYHPEHNEHNGHDSYSGYDYHHPDNHYGPPGPELGPDHHYGPQTYEIHAISYPPSSYGGGPSKPVYGPPSPPGYGHPVPIYIHEDSRDTIWDKFKSKIDIYTIGKILLKLIIFKKIVKFVALIGLLMFLPKLKNMMKDDDDDEDDEMDPMESRKISTDKDKLNERVNEITKFALTAIETFSRKYDDKCKRDQIWCRFQRTFDVIDAKYPYEKIVKLYLPDSYVDTNEIK